MPPTKYETNGFNLANTLDADGLVYLPQAAVAITKGQCIVDDAAGYATNVGTAFAATFRGIAAAASDNSAGAVGDLNIAVIPPRPHYIFWVKNESATVAVASDVGEAVDLESNDGIDVTDTTLVEWGFLIDEIDISAGAVAANAGGFVRGRFEKQPQ
jgi:hypothetical protein